MKNQKLDNYLCELGWLANSEYREDTLFGAIEDYTSLLTDMSNYIHDELINNKVSVTEVKRETKRAFKEKAKALHKRVNSKWGANIFLSLSNDPKATVSDLFDILLDLMIKAEQSGETIQYYVSSC